MKIFTLLSGCLLALLTFLFPPNAHACSEFPGAPGTVRERLVGQIGGPPITVFSCVLNPSPTSYCAEGEEVQVDSCDVPQLAGEPCSCTVYCCEDFEEPL